MIATREPQMTRYDVPPHEDKALSPISVRLPIDLYEYVKQKAEETDRTLSGYLIHLIRRDLRANRILSSGDLNVDVLANKIAEEVSRYGEHQK